MRNVDSLNNIVTEYEDIDISTYFKAMDITKEQQEEREEAAEDIWWLLLLLFALIESSIEDGDLDYAFIYETFVESYTELVSKYAEIDEYIKAYISKFTRDTLDATWDNIDIAKPNDSYWTSRKRAVGIAVNEANTILNYEDLVRAIKEGKNTKVWHTMKDPKVRKEHAELEGKKIGITEFFKVGDSLLLFPRDELHCEHIRDIANCRCYSKAVYDPRFREVTVEDIYNAGIIEGYKQYIGDN